jgi:anti-sigma factor RsiW
MDHQDALRLAASEKYLLNEISRAERDEFEKHFFDCPECAEEVRTTAAFLAGTKLELGRPRAAPESGNSSLAVVNRR